MKKLTTEEKFEMQLHNPFYKEVDKEDKRIKHDQLYKAALKYDKPFDPDDWTPQELKDHFLQENYDQRVYGVAMAVKLEEFGEEIEFLKLENRKLKAKLEKYEGAKPSRQNYYTDEEIEVIKKYYNPGEHGAIGKIAKILNRSESGIRRKIHFLTKEGELF